MKGKQARGYWLRRVLGWAVLALLIIVAPACTMTYLPDILAPGPTIVIPGNAPERSVVTPRCSVGRIGMTINDALEVIGFASSSPARSAGIRFGDIVRTIDGAHVYSVAHAQQLSSGPPGTWVDIAVWRHTSGRTLYYSVLRQCL
jgi:C-terminal processing protease CtpA/Prc